MYEVLRFPLVPLTSSWKVDSTKSLPAEQPEGSDLFDKSEATASRPLLWRQNWKFRNHFGFFFFARITRTSNTYEALSFKHLS